MGSILGGGGGGSGGGGLFGGGGSILDPLGIFKQTGGNILDPLNLLGQLKGQQHPGQGQMGQQPMTPAGVQYAQQQSQVAPGYNVSSPMGPTGFGTGSGSGKPPGQ